MQDIYKIFIAFTLMVSSGTSIAGQPSRHEKKRATLAKIIKDMGIVINDLVPCITDYALPLPKKRKEWQCVKTQSVERHYQNIFYYKKDNNLFLRAAAISFNPKTLTPVNHDLSEVFTNMDYRMGGRKLSSKYNLESQWDEAYGSRKYIKNKKTNELHPLEKIKTDNGSPQLLGKDKIAYLQGSKLVARRFLGNELEPRETIIFELPNQVIYDFVISPSGKTILTLSTVFGDQTNYSCLRRWKRKTVLDIS